MKKFIVIAIALFTAAAVYAQPRAIGGRLGYGLELSYQHSLGDNMVQLDFGLPGFYGLEAAATYDWIFRTGTQVWEPALECMDSTISPDLSVLPDVSEWNTTSGSP